MTHRTWQSLSTEAAPEIRVSPQQYPELADLRTEAEIQAVLHELVSTVQAASQLIKNVRDLRPPGSDNAPIYSSIINQHVPNHFVGEVRSSASHIQRFDNPAEIDDAGRRELVANQLHRLAPHIDDLQEPVEHYVYGMFGAPVSINSDVVDGHIDEQFFADVMVSRVRLRDSIPNGAHEIHDYGPCGVAVTLRSGSPEGSVVLDAICAPTDPVAYKRAESDTEEISTLSISGAQRPHETFELMHDVFDALNPRGTDIYRSGLARQLGSLLTHDYYANTQMSSESLATEMKS